MRRFGLGDVAGRTFDIAIVGGGITGASTARDAALRGLSTVLVEKGDFASGTSSRSTKLLHGGVRYLESYQFRLVRESCRERELMLKLAPHLATVRPFIYVLYRGYPEKHVPAERRADRLRHLLGQPPRRRHRMLRGPLCSARSHTSTPTASRAEAGTTTSSPMMPVSRLSPSRGPRRRGRWLPTAWK